MLAEAPNPGLFSGTVTEADGPVSGPTSISCHPDILAAVLLAAALSTPQKRSEQFPMVIILSLLLEKHAVGHGIELTIACDRGGSYEGKDNGLDASRSWCAHIHRPVTHQSTITPFLTTKHQLQDELKINQLNFPEVFETIEQGPRLPAAGSLAW